MLPSRRAIFYHANSFLRSNSRYHNNHVSRLSSISHKNQGSKTPEELSRLYKTSEVSEVDNNTTRSSGLGSGSGAPLNVTPKGVDDRNMYEEPSDSVTRTAKVAAAGALESGLRFGKMVKQTVDGIWDSTKEATENMRDSVADDVDDTGRRGAQTFDIDGDTGRRRAQASDIDDTGRRGAQTFDIDDVDDSGCRRAQACDIDDAGRRGAQTFAVDDVYDTGSRGSDDRIEDESQDKFVEELRRRAGGYDLKDGR